MQARHTLDSLDTPALLVEWTPFQQNIAFMAEKVASVSTGWRPHAKAHKSPAVAHQVIGAGALGITCAKVGEAEVYAASGIRDILIANQVVGAIKTRRLANLARWADVVVAVDCIENVREIDAAASAAGTKPRVVIEINSGMNRSGVLPGEPVLELAGQVATLGHLRFVGVMTWEGHTLTIPNIDKRRQAVRASLEPVRQTVEALAGDGHDVTIVSCGGTGTFLTTAELHWVTEVQAGGGIFGDRFYRELDVPVEPALSVLATVTSHPIPERVITDTGRALVVVDGDDVIATWPTSARGRLH